MGMSMLCYFVAGIAFIPACLLALATVAEIVDPSPVQEQDRD